MFYALYKFFEINLFQYISVRAGIGFFIAFILTALILQSLWLGYLKKAQKAINKYVPNMKKRIPYDGKGLSLCLVLTFTMILVRYYEYLYHNRG